MLNQVQNSPPQLVAVMVKWSSVISASKRSLATCRFLDWNYFDPHAHHFWRWQPAYAVFGHRIWPLAARARHHCADCANGAAVNNLSGSRATWFQSMDLSTPSFHRIAPDIFTWSLLFYHRAHLFSDARHAQRLRKTIHRRSADDAMVTSVDPCPGGIKKAASFFSSITTPVSKHYFQTGFDDEKAMLDSNLAMGWVRTGERFAAWKRHHPYAQQVFRFYRDVKAMA